MQEKLLKICRRKIYNAKDEKQKNRLSIIEQMLEIPNCFVHMSFDSALNVLIELGLTEEKAKKAYILLAGFSNFVEGQKWTTLKHLN